MLAVPALTLPEGCTTLPPGGATCFARRAHRAWPTHRRGAGEARSRRRPPGATPSPRSLRRPRSGVRLRRLRDAYLRRRSDRSGAHRGAVRRRVVPGRHLLPRVVRRRYAARPDPASHAAIVPVDHATAAAAMGARAAAGAARAPLRGPRFRMVGRDLLL